ncbi:MAG: hypothetical protein AB7F86_18140 [Bdellovibrionales bacterium]
MKSVLIVLSLLSFNAFATLEVVDEGGVLAKLAGYSRGLKFEDVKTCGTQYPISATEGSCSYRCTGSFCTSTCSGPSQPQFAVAAENCEADSFDIYGENGIDLHVTREDFTQGGNTLVLPFLRDLDRYFQPTGKVVLTNVFPSMASIIQDGDKKMVTAYDIWAEVRFTEGTMGAGFQITVIPSFKDLRQIAVIGTTPNSYFYKIAGVVRDEGF